MPENDIELGQSPSKSKSEEPRVDTSEPESFYRDANTTKGMNYHQPSRPSSWVHVVSEDKDGSSRESSKEDPPTKPSIPPRTQKPQSRSSVDMDDNESKNLKAEHRNLKKEYDETRQELRSAWRENKEQSLELRDLKKHNAHLKETIRAQADP
ncbi:MAG: hypothetical protein Q9198_009886, partial [Flavoplaca austrocitrina]